MSKKEKYTDTINRNSEYNNNNIYSLKNYTLNTYTNYNGTYKYNKSMVHI